MVTQEYKERSNRAHAEARRLVPWFLTEYGSMKNARLAEMIEHELRRQGLPIVTSVRIPQSAVIHAEAEGVISIDRYWYARLGKEYKWPMGK
jgi:hypothetical protein